jgi:hypothetical protein
VAFAQAWAYGGVQMPDAYKCETGEAKKFQRLGLYPLPGRALRLGHGGAQVGIHDGGKMTRRLWPVATYERTRPHRP